MKAELRRIHSPDVYDLTKYLPDEADKFSILIQAIVGPKGELGEESFDMQVCTPKWLLESYEPNEVIFGRHLVIVFNYNYDRIYRKVKSYIEMCSGDSWREIAERIGRIGKWEFEDYSE